MPAITGESVPAGYAEHDRPTSFPDGSFPEGGVEPAPPSGSSVPSRPPPHPPYSSTKTTKKKNTVFKPVELHKNLLNWSENNLLNWSKKLV